MVLTLPLVINPIYQFKMLGFCLQAITCLGTRTTTLPVSFVSKWFLQTCPWPNLCPEYLGTSPQPGWQILVTYILHSTNACNVCTKHPNHKLQSGWCCKPSTRTKHGSSSFSTVEVRHSIGAMDKFRHLQRMVIDLGLPGRLRWSAILLCV